MLMPSKLPLLIHYSFPPMLSKDQKNHSKIPVYEKIEGGGGGVSGGR